jgi:hypothetical protein
MTNKIIEVLKKNVVSFNDHDVIFGGDGDLTDLANELEQAINYTRCSTQLPTEDEILSESNSRQLEGAEPYSFAGGARWALSNIKQIPKTQKED